MYICNSYNLSTWDLPDIYIFIYIYIYIYIYMYIYIYIYIYISFQHFLTRPLNEIDDYYQKKHVLFIICDASNQF